MEGKVDTTLQIQALINAAVENAVAAAVEQVRKELEAALSHTAQTAAKAAVGAVERQRNRMQEEDHDWKLHNTRLLLKNYRRLAEYYENAVLNLDDAEEAAGADFETTLRMMQNRDGNDELIVASMQRHYLETRIIMAHVEKMLDIYADMCERSPRPEASRRWRCLYYMYLSPEAKTADEIAEEESMDRRTVYRDIDTCTSDLAALFFGVAGLNRKK